MYHILNWNTGLTEDDQFLEEILQYIKGFLDQDNSIAVLQQIPYKDYENKWNLHAIYMRILEVFPEKKKQSVEKALEMKKMMTILIMDILS